MLYWGSEDEGSWRIETASKRCKPENPSAHAIKLPAAASDPAVLRVVASKSHFSEETKEFVDGLAKNGKTVELVSRGSSLKLCMIAEGTADIYPRLGPTMEWDTAAGHAIAKYAGCEVKQYGKDEELAYNKEDLLNPWFVVE